MNKKVLIGIALFLFMVIVLGYQLYYRPHQALDLKTQLSQYDNLVSELERIQEENRKLAMEIRRLKMDQQYIEQLLRERGYIYPGEELHILPPPRAELDEVD